TADARARPPARQLLPRLRRGRHRGQVRRGRRDAPRRKQADRLDAEGQAGRCLRLCRKASRAAGARHARGRYPLERPAVKRTLPLVVAAVALAGCGGATAQRGHATLWVTRDRGSHVLLVRQVPAGLTAMQALDRVADIETRYGGRYVQGIDGVDGSLSAQRDWFYFVNGIEADRSAAEYRLHDGDVEWWDYRSWARRMRQPVVVGAFPAPFSHGETVLHASHRYGSLPRKLLKVIHGQGQGPRSVIELVPGRGFH